MNDINFFSPYQSVQKDKNDIVKYFYLAFGGLLLFVVISGGINFVRIFMLNSEIKSYTEKLEEPSVKGKLEEAERINGEISTLTNYDKSVSNILDKIKKRDSVSYAIMSQLNSTIPSEIHYKSMSLDGNELKISGISSGMDAVGELQHNLKSLNNMNDVFVKSINKNDSVAGEYSFEIECLLKDVG
ncbi:fimbrial protein [Clostridium butyricum]|jgi:type IV pilus assembly protein PilN|uniref:Fimbrial protein n=1 Tax=Clostridium butyricum TaxID=1492 RepID=A0A6L9EMW6_CLOBU|nr:fimbrial protein [Clostridium butyricum]